MRRGLHHGISLETSVSDFSGRRQARSVVGDRRRRRNLHFGIVQRPAIRHAAQGAKERRQIGQARNFRRTDSRSRGTRPWWCDHGCGAAETEPRVDYSGAWRYRHVGQRILLRRWHRDRCLRPQGWHPNPHPANARQAQPASTRFPHQQRQRLSQPPQGMAASFPWRRDEEPAQLPWLAPHSGGLGRKDHARGFYLWSDRIRPISTINAIRAKDELCKIAEADGLRISPFREDGVTYGIPTWIWSVAIDGALHVRGYNGQNSRWYQAAVRHKAGRIIAAGMTREVTFEPVDGPINDLVDDAYRAKYHGSPYLSPMISARARSATVKVMPSETSA